MEITRYESTWDVVDAKTIQEDVISLVEIGQRKYKTLPDEPAAKGIGPSIGSAAPSPAPSDTGIASPLTEQSRTYHTTKAVSSDGLFVWSVPNTIVMLDANGETVQMIYAEPT